MKSLFINNVSMQALGVFKERTVINLSTEADKPIVLIEGKNGCGKTTLLQALQIGLYGYRAFGSKGKQAYRDYLQNLIRKDVVEDPFLSVDVSLKERDEVADYQITRTWEIKSGTLKETFSVYKDHVSQDLKEEDWVDLINDFLPVDLSNLFFFDGEKIEQMANPDELPLILRQATETLLGVGLIDSTVADLLSFDRRSLTKLKADNKLDESLKEQYSKKVNELESIKEKIEIKNQAKASLQSSKDRIDAELYRLRQQSDRQGLRAFKDAVALKEQLSTLESRCKDLRDRQLELCADPLYPLAYGEAVWSDLKTLVQREEQVVESVKVAKAIKTQEKRLLEILVKEFPEHSERFGAIFQKEQETVDKNVGGKCYFHPLDTAKFDDRIQKIRAAYSRLSKEIEAVEGQILKNQTAIEQAPSEEKVELLLKKLHSQEVECDRVKNELENTASDLKSLLEQRDRMAVSVSNLGNTIRKDLNSQERLRFSLDASKRAREILLQYKENILKSKSNLLSKNITLHLKNILRKKDFVKEITIDPETFQLNVIGRKGNDISVQSLSAGERQMLATAILRAIMAAKCSSIPVVVDTPLARLDGTHRMNLVKDFYSKVSHQVIILSTDEEITGSLKNEIDKYLSHSYQFVFNEDSQATTVTTNDRSDQN